MNTVLEEHLRVPADPGGFDEAELADVDEPVRRYFRAAIAPGTPMARATRFHMRGSIKIGNRWLPFRADELLAPLQGYHWPATVAGGLLRGSDTYAFRHAVMIWKLFGVVPMIRADGPDVARSAVGRAATESIWLPTALLPRYGVHWSAASDELLIADVPIDGERVALQVNIDGDGRVRWARVDRWHDPEGTGTFGWFPFGLDATSSTEFGCGITMPAAGIGGWFHGTDRWGEGQFMRYSISELTLI